MYYAEEQYVRTLSPTDSVSVAQHSPPGKVQMYYCGQKSFCLLCDSELVSQGTGVLLGGSVPIRQVAYDNRGAFYYYGPRRPYYLPGPKAGHDGTRFFLTLIFGFLLLGVLMM